jgi:hypothetical protein
MTVEIDGIPWTRVPTFEDSGPSDRHFTAAVDPRTGAASIRFGDGTRGAQPPTGQANVIARYRTGLGSTGNTPPGGDNPLRDLLELITDQVELLEADLERLYGDQFVETTDRWVIPYPIDGPAVGRWTFSRADGRKCLCLELVSGRHQRG